MPTSAPLHNLLLEAISPESRSELLAHADHVALPLKMSLQAQGETPRYAYFLTSGIASVVVSSEEGGSAETSLIGNEGLTGAFSLLGPTVPPTDCFIQLSGTGYRLSLSTLRKHFQSSEEIRTRILECVQQQAMTTSQLAACNKLHEAEARLARWLLMVQDRTHEPSFQLTQEFLAMMLGTRRTTMALVAGALQRAGFLEYTRGRITIQSREHLEAAACDCYAVTRDLLARLYKGPTYRIANQSNGLGRS